MAEERLEMKRALLEAFETFFELQDHLTAMRHSMERMELYIFIMVIFIASLTVFGFLGALSYLCIFLCTRWRHSDSCRLPAPANHDFPQHGVRVNLKHVPADEHSKL